MLSIPEVQAQLLDVKATGEVRALQRFYQVLGNDQDRAVYGFAHVFIADENVAVEELLVTDKLFKSADFVLRSKYVALVESVKAHGGLVYVFSSMHISGQQLDSYTGIAATLRFPLPEELFEVPGVEAEGAEEDGEDDENEDR